MSVNYLPKCDKQGEGAVCGHCLEANRALKALPGINISLLYMGVDHVTCCIGASLCT